MALSCPSTGFVSLAARAVDMITPASTDVFALTSSLSQTQTNGLSTWGTIGSPTLPKYLSDDSQSGSAPWGTKTASTTNAYVDYPTSGTNRVYNFTLTRGYLAPDGYSMDVMLVNGQFPGPLIEANWGDTITVTVTNNITSPAEGTSVHWHGFLQTDTPWDDGVPGVTQCPIAPGNSYTYSFNASLYGSTWYHSHYSAQYTSGIVGPMVIYGPSENNYDVDVGPVLLSDWYHEPYIEILETILAPSGSPVYYSKNNLINGKNNFNCSSVKSGDTSPCNSNAGISSFTFQTNKTHLLRLVNTGSEGVQRFSIDNHIMTIIANDFVPVQPYNTTVVTLSVGQRSDVLVTANAGGPQSSFWIRSNITTCSLADQPYGVAALYYDQANTTLKPTSKGWDVPDPGTCANDPLSDTVPLYPLAVSTPNVTQTMYVELYTNASKVALWKFNNVSARVDYNSPILPMVNSGEDTFDENWNVINYNNNKSIRIVIINQSPSSHPIHLHGHNFYVLSEGAGETWNGTITRPDNPQRRDTQLVRANGYLALQFDGNPGVWVFHCHIAWHASGGFLTILVVNPDGAVQNMKIPSGSGSDMCNDWSSWTNHHDPNQIDSGD